VREKRAASVARLSVWVSHQASSRSLPPTLTRSSAASPLKRWASGFHRGAVLRADIRDTPRIGLSRRLNAEAALQRDVVCRG
jgi:hypothetical protein